MTAKTERKSRAYTVHYDKKRRGTARPTLILPRALYNAVIARVSAALRAERDDCRAEERRMVKHRNYAGALEMHERADALDAVSRIQDFVDMAVTEDWFEKPPETKYVTVKNNGPFPLPRARRRRRTS